jgi:hypothetical protein
MGRETGTLQLLTPLLLTGGKGADLVIRGDVVLNTLSARSTSTLLRDQICINSPSSRQVLRPSRTVLRDSLRILFYALERYVFRLDQFLIYSLVTLECLENGRRTTESARSRDAPIGAYLWPGNQPELRHSHMSPGGDSQRQSAARCLHVWRPFS